MIIINLVSPLWNERSGLWSSKPDPAKCTALQAFRHYLTYSVCK